MTAGRPLGPRRNEKDHELKSRESRFVRYEDEMPMFYKSRRAAERTLENIMSYIENRLFLTLNREKTVISQKQGRRCFERTRF